MGYLTTKITVSFFSVFSLLIMNFFFSSSCPLILSTDVSNFTIAFTDTIPQKKMRMDTIITFDPATKTESISIIEVVDEAVDLRNRLSSERRRGTIDTMIIFDPVTKKETIRYIEN